MELISMPRERFARVWEVLESGQREKVAPSFVAAVYQVQSPGKAWVASLGCEPDTVFDLASVTKIYATAMLASVLVERRWLRWEQPLADFIPEFSDSGILIRHLLSHTAGFPAWLPLWEKLKADPSLQMRDLVVKTKPEVPPGTRVLYSDIGFILLKYALEECAGVRFENAVQRWLWNPMGLKKSFYVRFGRALPIPVSKIAATEIVDWRGGSIQGQPHDENCFLMGGVSGHAGVFAPAEDLMIWAEHLLRNHFPGRETLRQAWTRASQPSGCSRTLGWDTPSGDSPSIGQYFSTQSVGHLGFTGTSFWLDPENGIAVALLTNRVNPTRENIAIRAFRPRFHDAVWLEFKT